jgi:hypothetical protein
MGVFYDKLIIVYSFTKAIDILGEKISEEKAIEYLHFHVMLSVKKVNLGYGLLCSKFIKSSIFITNKLCPLRIGIVPNML